MQGQAIYTKPEVTVVGLEQAMSDAVKDARKAIPVRFSVQSSLVSVVNVPIWGMIADRDLTVMAIAFRVASLVGLNANLGLALVKNGAAVAGGTFAVTPAKLSQGADLTLQLAKGDLLTLDRTGLTALATSGIVCGYLSVT